MDWIYVVVAGLFEVAWVIGMKYSQGWSKLYPSVVTIIAMIVSFQFLSLALKTLPIGTAYAIWTGIGTIGAAILGMLIFGEPRTVSKIICIVLIVAGIVGLKLTSAD